MDARDGGSWISQVRRFFLEYVKDELGIEKVPMKKVVCPTCRGEGSHVNPSIDSHGLTAEDFEQDPDFEEGYREGRYDVACYECDGLRVVDDFDFDRCPKLQKEWEEYVDDAQADHATEMAERAMGA